MKPFLIQILKQFFAVCECKIILKPKMESSVENVYDSGMEKEMQDLWKKRNICLWM
mgnify:CR=1 FL=1